MVPQSILDHLVATYKPLAIVQHGSRVRGDAGAGSDYDITILTATDCSSQPYIYEGAAVDVSDERPDMPVLLSHNVPTWPLLAVYDTDGSGAALVARTKAAFEKGPDALTAEQIDNRKNFIKRYYSRLGARGSEPALRLFYLGEMAERFIRYYFELRQRWTQSYHVMVATIAAEDATYKVQLDALAGDDYMKAMASLYERLFNEPL